MRQLDKTKVEILRRAFIDVAQDIRHSFMDADIGSFLVKLQASGRSFNGEAVLTCEVSTSEYGNGVRSPDIIAAHVECMRREGFDLANQQLALPSPGTELEDEIPF
jgi:hypothetical protein